MQDLLSLACYKVTCIAYPRHLPGCKEDMADSIGRTRERDIDMC